MNDTHLFGPRYRGTTVGAFALVFLAAFEVLAVTTVMPTVTAELNGRDWYAVAFSAPLGASIIGIIAAGMWSDRVGGVRPLLTSVALFSVGLVIAGLAPNIVVFLLGRLIHGLGGGGLNVALYVLVAQVYDEADRPKLFGLFSLAWILPGLLGPFLAGIIAETVGWRWVFLGVFFLALIALSLLLPRLRTVEPPTVVPQAYARHDLHRLGLAGLVASAVIVLNLVGGLGGWTQALAATVAVLFTLVAMRPLMPAGMFRAAPGLPSIIGYRGLIGGGFAASEAYIPFLLQEQYAVAIWLSGLALTAASVGWAIASQIQGRLGTGFADFRTYRIGSVIVLTGLGALTVAASLHLPAIVLGACWFVGGLGMGFSFPRTSTGALARASQAERGSVSSSLTLSDIVGAAVGVGLAGMLFTAAGTADDLAPFVWVYAMSTAFMAGAVVFGRRV